MDNRRFRRGGRIIMTSWTARIHRRAANSANFLTACTHPHPYPLRIEKVKFGVPLDEVFKNDIPGPLLVLILKLNKEAPYKKDVFRAPGHQGNMKKLIHFLQHGRLVNIDNFSVYTIASVLKKFLRKLPDGIFGREGEQKLFEMIEMTSVEEQRDHIHSLIASLPVCTQRLIVLLFGTFRVISNNSERSQTGMTSEALGVSVAPSFFQSCVSDGKTAKMEDVMKFKVATKIMKFLIDNFGVSNLFGRENYEYYARITGRILKVEEDWIFSFRYPPDGIVSRLMSLEAEKTWLQYESERWGLKFNLAAMSKQEESHSTPALLQSSDELETSECEPCSSLTIIPENNLLESYTRLSISLEDNGLFKVHERQAARMKTRSEWFLSPSPSSKSALGDVEQDSSSNQYYVLREESAVNRTGPGSLFSSSAESLKQLVRRSSSKEKDRRLVRRSSSKKNKENGSSGGGSSSTNKPKSTSPSQTNQASGIPPYLPSDTSINSTSSNVVVSSPSVANNSSVLGIESTIYSVTSDAGPGMEDDSNVEQFYSQDQATDPLITNSNRIQSKSSPSNEVFEQDCTETDVQTFHVTLCYKPRI